MESLFVTLLLAVPAAAISISVTLVAVLVSINVLDAIRERRQD